MRILSQPLSAVLWGLDGVLLDASAPDSDPPQPDPWTIERLTALQKRGVQQAILANVDPSRADWVEANLAAFPGVDAIFAPARIGATLPDAGAFVHAISALDLDPGAILFIDTDASHVNAAARAGMRSFRYSKLARDALQRELTARR